MSKIIRSDINKKYVYSGIVEAEDFVFLSFCVGNVGAAFEEQVNGAIDDMERRLHTIGLTLDSVVKISTEFAHAGGINGLQLQIDAIAYKN